MYETVPYTLDKACRSAALLPAVIHCVVLTAVNMSCRYNSVMKLIFLAATFTMIYFMRVDKQIKGSYDGDQDTFRYQFLILPCFVLALIINYGFSFTEVCRGLI